MSNKNKAALNPDQSEQITLLSSELERAKEQLEGVHLAVAYVEKDATVGLAEFINNVINSKNTEIEELSTKIDGLVGKSDESEELINEIYSAAGYKTGSKITLVEHLSDLVGIVSNDKSAEQISDLKGEIATLKERFKRLQTDSNAYRSLAERKTEDLKALQSRKQGSVKDEGDIQVVVTNFSDYKRTISHVAFKIGNRPTGQVILPVASECENGYNLPFKIHKEDLEEVKAYLSKNHIGFKIEK